MNQKWIFGLVALVSLIVGLYFATVVAPPEPAAPQHASLYPAPRQLPEFSLYDQNNQAFTNEQLMGHWTLAFVGYTYCPDICPTTLAELKQIYPQLQQIESKHPVQIWFISVDPQRDSAERLNQYINFFNPDFIASSAEHKVLFPLIRAMGMMYSMSGDTDSEDYLVDHSAAVTIINPQGQVIGRFKPEMVPGQLAVSDSQKILTDMPILMD